MMRIKTLCLLALLGLNSSLALAMPPSAGFYPPAQYQEPGSMLREGLEKAIHFLTQGPQNGQQVRAFVEQEIAPYFDFEYMNYWVMGNLQRQMSPQQAIAMQHRLRGMFLQAMARQLASYKHGRIEYLRPRGNPSSGEVSLGIRVHSHQGYASRLNFRLYQSPQGWKVFDVIADGQSVVAHYRAMFARQASMGGRQQPAVYPSYR